MFSFMAMNLASNMHRCEAGGNPRKRYRNVLLRSKADIRDTPREFDLAKGYASLTVCCRPIPDLTNDSK
jgi:hypothetical protein